MNDVIKPGMTEALLSILVDPPKIFRDILAKNLVGAKVSARLAEDSLAAIKIIECVCMFTHD